MASCNSQSEGTDTGLDSILFEHLFEHSPDGIVLVDGNDRVIRTNSAFEALFGYSVTECVGRPIDELIVAPGFHDEASEISSEVLDGTPVRVESSRMTRDGNILDVEVSGVPIRSTRGQIGIFGIYRDISARNNAEALLVQREQQYRTIVESLIDGYFELDLDGSLLFCNAALRDMLEVDDDRVVGLRILDRVVDEDRVRVMRAFLKVAHRGASGRGISIRIVDAQGSTRTLECSVSQIRSDAGTPSGFRGTLRDVTRRARAEAQIAHSERAYRTMALATGQLVYDADFATGRIHWLGAIKAVLGCDMNEARLIDLAQWERRIHPDDRARAVEALDRAQAANGEYIAEYRFQRADGVWIDIVDRGSFLAAEHGAGTRMIGTMSDVTERKREQQAFASARAEARVTLDSISDAVIRTDLDGKVQYLNPVACRLTGRAPEHAIGAALPDVMRILFWESDESAVEIDPLELLRDPELLRSRAFCLDGRTGRYSDIELSITALADSRSSGGFVIVFRDVTESRRKSRQIAWQAQHDSLTGLFNRRKFESEAEKLLSLNLGEEPHCLLYMDLDQFKLVNDSCGHHVGDQLLAELAALMHRQVRKSDLLARLGGDEFALLLQSCTLERGIEVAEKLVAAINDFEFAWRQQRFQVGISVGVVEVAGATTLTEALQAADQACYMAKDNGRNQISAFRPGDEAHQQNGIQLRTAVEVSDALHNNRFQLHFQRIKALREDLPGERCEILLRMLGRDGSLVSPGLFIPAAERFNKIVMLDRWVVEHALEAIGKASARGEIGREDRFSINLSGATFSQSDSLEFVTREFARNGVDPENVCFEITESNAISRLSEALEFINGIRRLGCSISLDDFGSGFSSFGYLKMLPIDSLKIDGELVRDMRNSRLGRAMVGGIAQIARTANIPCVAEQVEHIEDLDVLRELGIDFAQGFAIHKPERWPLAD